MKAKLSLKLLIVSLFLYNSAASQDWVEIKKIKLPSTPISFSKDTEENIYLGFPNGSLAKFSSEGVELPRFSLPNQSSLTLIEAQNNRKIFFFQKDIQQLSIVDRFSALPKQYPLADFGTDYVSMLCPAPDGTVWLAEYNPPRLKKVDVIRKTVIHEVQHSLGDSISFMRAVQNLLYIVNETGLHILDQFGNQLSSIALDISYLHLSNKELIATQREGFVLIDPYSSQVTESLKFPNKKVEVVFKLKEKYAVVESDNLLFYTLNSKQAKSK